jgi:hypothetical protein
MNEAQGRLLSDGEELVYLDADQIKSPIRSDADRYDQAFERRRKALSESQPARTPKASS